MERELRCKHCDRYIGKAYGTIIAELTCPNSSCKAGNQFKIINGDVASDMRHKFLTLPKAPKKKEIEVS